MARPPKAPEERHTTDLRVRLREVDMELIREAAQVDGMKISTWAREVLLRVARRRARR